MILPTHKTGATEQKSTLGLSGAGTFPTHSTVVSVVAGADGSQSSNVSDDEPMLSAADLDSANVEQKSFEFPEKSIYFVTCEELSLGRSDIEVVEAALQGGVPIVQYREKPIDRRKTVSAAKRLHKAMALRKLTRRYRAKLIINDDVKLALSCGADGVHLGQSDSAVANARLLEKEAIEKNGCNRLIIGKSTHNPAEIKNAVLEDIDYLNIGPIFPTSTKHNTYPDLGVEGLTHCVAALQQAMQETGKSLPFTVMGGIKAIHLSRLAALGVCHVAMITAISQAEDIVKTIKQMIDDFYPAIKR